MRQREEEGKEKKEGGKGEEKNADKTIGNCEILKRRFSIIGEMKMFTPTLIHLLVAGTSSLSARHRYVLQAAAGSTFLLVLTDLCATRTL